MIENVTSCGQGNHKTSSDFKHLALLIAIGQHQVCGGPIHICHLFQGKCHDFPLNGPHAAGRDALSLLDCSRDWAPILGSKQDFLMLESHGPRRFIAFNTAPLLHAKYIIQTDGLMRIGGKSSN